MKSIILVQARQGASRLPNKVLCKLGKFSLIEWVLIRLSMCAKIDGVVCAIPNEANADLLLALKVLKEKIDFIICQGSENNVHDRFRKAIQEEFCPSKNLRKDQINIIRVCADRPFIDPILIDYLVKTSSPDYMTYNHSIDGVAFGNGMGAELIGCNLSQLLFFEDRELIDKEHVTLKIYKKHKEKLKFSIPTEYEKYLKILQNITTVLDTKEDLIAINEIVNKFDLTPYNLNLTRQLAEECRINS